MKWWHVLGIVLCLMSGGCATLTTGELGIPLTAAGGAAPEGSAPLVVRSRKLEDISSAHLPVIEVSFQNPSSEWHNITTARILVANPEVTGVVKIPLNHALRDWQVATGQRQAVAAANRKTASELVTAGGLIVAGVGSQSDNEDVQLGTAIVGLLAASAGAGMHYSDRKNDAEQLPLAPSTHLLAGPISVPPGMIVKRWILLYTPDQESSDDLRLVLSYDLAERGTQRVMLRSKRKVSVNPHAPSTSLP